jgi:hypothetical protein
MNDDDRKPDDQRDDGGAGGFWYKLFKGILIALGLLAVAAVMIVGLVLGACFLGSRR